MRVQSQATVGAPGERGFPENVTWERAGVQFVTVNMPGSNDDTLPWWCNCVNPTPADPFASLSQRQADEVRQRTAADEAWLDRAFQEAIDAHAAGVLIGLQADMWDPAQVANGEGLDQYDGFVRHLAALARAFGRPVLLINGDSHVYGSDNPLSSDDPLYALYPLGYDVPNFTRITVHGKTTPLEWLKLRVDPSSPDVFSWSQVVVP